MQWFETLSELVQPYSEEIIYSSYVIFAIGFSQNIIYFVQIVIAAFVLLRTKLVDEDAQDEQRLSSDITLPISIIIPAYNEEVTIAPSVLSILTIHYPSFEVIVVNDGSADSTLQILIDQYGLVKTDRYIEEKLTHKKIRGIYTSPTYTHLVVVDKENGGRSDALNAGIDTSRNPVFCTVDADSQLDSAALLKTIKPFIDRPDKVVATGGSIRILNGCEVEAGELKKVGLPKKTLAIFQVVEYLRSFLTGRLAWGQMGILTIISGAYAMIRRDVAIEVGGFDTKTIGEDFEMVMKIHKHHRQQKRPYEICFVPEAACWTEVPESFEVLRNQRIRWQQGALEVFFKHREMFLNPRYGRIGLVAYPLILIIDIIGPLAELFGYFYIPLFYFLGVLNFDFMIALLCLFFAFGVFFSTMSLFLEEASLKRFGNFKDLTILWFFAIIENFGYRQYNSIWRFIGWWRFLRKKQQWGNMTRVGLEKKS